ncbi:hypothetical protein niasHT_039664 [Heterodera trifolii]|uniref:histone acetyltransferase n=1 Tax=Heterodera trifolii TaxID=157864 RepID=A0ABD2I9V2_9BILA
MNIDIERHQHLTMPFITASTSDKEHYVINDRSASCSSDDQFSCTKYEHIDNKNCVADKQIGSSRPRGELKGLQDSLSQYFTPTEVRRSRVTTSRLASEQPLEIMVEPSSGAYREHRTNSISSSKSGNSTISPKSPHRRDRLEDALSPYFTPNPNKRRTHKEGEYLQLARGSDTLLGNVRKEDMEVTIDMKFENEAHYQQKDEDQLESQAVLTEFKQFGRVLRHVQPNKSDQQHFASENNLQKRAEEYRKKRENVAVRKSAQLVRRAFKGKCGPGQLRVKMSQPVSSTLKPNKAPSSLKNSIKNYFQPLKKAPSVQITENQSINFSFDIDEENRTLFEETRTLIQRDFDNANSALKNLGQKPFPPKIRINCYEIDTWYSSPYPQEFSCLPVLHICDSCLLYLSVPESHFKKCKRRFPPGTEIYRDGPLSVFEVDGNLARVFCRNLCLLAKLFIDHKTLYFDVEPFLFYVLTLHDEMGCHFVGYFSKEKYSSQKYNLACIVTLPCYQGMGFGRFLIEFSYLLSRRENLIGSPERPLSDLGRISYHSYWLSAIYQFLYKTLLMTAIPQTNQRISLEAISRTTGIAVSDIAETLAENRLLCNRDSSSSLIFDENAVKNYCEQLKCKTRYVLDESKLKWSPKIYTPSKDFRFRSPVLCITPCVNSPKKALDDGRIEDQESMPKNEESRKTTARRKPVPISEKTAQNQKASGTPSKKKMPKRIGFPEESSNSQTNTENEEGKAQITRKRRKKASCKTTVAGRENQKEPSTDGDDEKHTAELPRRFRQSTSSNGTTLNGEAVAQQRRAKGSSMMGKCVVSKQKRYLKLPEAEEMFPKEQEIEEKLTPESKKRWRSESESDGDSSITERKAKKGRNLWRKSHKLNRQPTRSSLPRNFSSSSSSSSPIMKRRMEADESLTNSASSKRQRKKGQPQQEDSPEDEEDDRSYCCSSTSPQPIGDRLPFLKTSTRDHDLLINMGGEPDTVNMGGEPDDEEGENAANISSLTIGLSSYKAPVLISHPIEAEDEDEEPPIVVVDQTQSHRQIDSHQQRSQAEDIAPLGQLQIVEKGVEAVQLCTVSHPSTNRLINIPSVHVGHHNSPFCSPSDAATVEMPALDAAEKHVSSPEGSACRFGEDHHSVATSTMMMMMEDDAPPMLSPQAANMASNEPIRTPGIGITCGHGDTMGERPYETESTEEPQIGTKAEQLLKDTNISGTEIEHAMASSMPSLGISEDNERNEHTQPTTTEKDGQSQGIDKEKQPICSTIEKEASRRESSEMDRATSSHGLLPFIEQKIPSTAASSSANQHNGTSIISPPLDLTHQNSAHQITQINYPNMNQFNSFSTLNGTLYNHQQQKQQQQMNYALAQQQQQQQPTTAQPKMKEKQNSEKSSSSKRAKEKPTKGTLSEKNQKSAAPPKHYQHESLPSTSALPQPAVPTSFSPQWFNNAQQMAQHFAQCYQQQQQHHYYGAAASTSRPADIASTMTAAHMGMGYPYFYNQWHQWQMSAAAAAGAAKFPGVGAAYPAGYEEFFNGMAMTGGANAMMAGVSSASPLTAAAPTVPSAASVYPWQSPMFAAAAQIRHPNASSTTISHHSFYPPSHPPM